MTFLYVWSTASWWADTFSAYVRCFVLSAYYWENLRVNTWKASNLNFCKVITWFFSRKLISCMFIFFSLKFEVQFLFLSCNCGKILSILRRNLVSRGNIHWVINLMPFSFFFLSFKEKNILTNDDSNENVDENMWKHDYSFSCFLFPELVSTSNVKILMFSNFLHPDIYVIYVKLSIILENKRWKQYNNKQKFDKSLTLTRVIILKRSTKYRFQINLKISIPPSYFYLFCIRTNCFLIHSKKNCRIDNFRIDNDRRYMVVYFISLQK